MAIQKTVVSTCDRCKTKTATNVSSRTHMSTVVPAGWSRVSVQVQYVRKLMTKLLCTACTVEHNDFLRKKVTA